MDNPIFIVGCDHSGTGIMLNILSQLENVYTVPEETYMFYNFDKFDSIYNDIKKIIKEKNYKRWLEKTPVHIINIDKIISKFPEGKIIVMIRDGRDVVASSNKRFGFQKSIDYWVSRNNIALTYKDNSNILFVRYEDLVSNSKKILHNICDFIGEKYSNNLLNYHKNKKYWYHPDIKKPEDYSSSTHRQYRNWQINQPLFDGRGKWKDKLSEKQIQYLSNNHPFITLMKKFNYEI